MNTGGATFEGNFDVDLEQKQISNCDSKSTITIDENPVQHDLMTKALPVARLEFLKMKLGLPKANLKKEC